jgi:hypothetical protein
VRHSRGVFALQLPAVLDYNHTYDTTARTLCPRDMDLDVDDRLTVHKLHTSNSDHGNIRYTIQLIHSAGMCAFEVCVSRSQLTVWYIGRVFNGCATNTIT